MNGNGMPTTGARLIAMRMLTVNWMKTIEAMPKVMVEPKWVGGVLGYLEASIDK